LDDELLQLCTHLAEQLPHYFISLVTVLPEQTEDTIVDFCTEFLLVEKIKLFTSLNYSSGVGVEIC